MVCRDDMDGVEAVRLLLRGALVRSTRRGAQRHGAAEAQSRREGDVAPAFDGAELVAFLRDE